MSELVILMSTYNGEKYLEEQINSLLQQTIINRMSVLIRDDGSTDNTLNILKKYSYNDNISFYQGNNIGCVMSFFELLYNAPSAKYYAFCDQDDYWLSEKMEKAILALEDTEKAALYCSSKYIVNQRLESLHQKDIAPFFYYLDVLMKPNIASGCTMVFNDKLREYFMMYRPIKRLYHDTWLFNLAYFLGKIIYSENSYILYRQHNNNVVGALNKKSFWQRIKNIDFKLSKYKNREKATLYSNILYKYYKDYMSPSNKKRLYNVSHARKNLICRLNLFFSSELDKSPLYEYIIYKIYIILGWL